MEVKINFIEPLFERVEGYSKTSFELFKLKALDKTAALTGTLVSRGAMILVISMFGMLANIGLALWLGDLLGRSYYGFFCVAGFYGITAALLYLFLDDPIRRRVSNAVIAQMMNRNR